MKKTMLAVSAAFAILASVPASAAQYMVSYSTAAGAFNGLLSTTDTADANGFFSITNLTGTHSGSAVSLIAPGNFPMTSLANDNLFKPTANFVTGNGFSYASAGVNYNVYYSSALTECSDAAGGCNDPSRYYAISNFVVANAVAPAVPEPATWGMMLLGMGAVGFAMRRRQKVSTKVAFA